MDSYRVETVRDDAADVALKDLDKRADAWRLHGDFGLERDACRKALELRDQGRNTTGIRPVVRVRATDHGVSRTILIMQRLRYRDEN